MPRGGFRLGSGRPKGSKDKKTSIGTARGGYRPGAGRPKDTNIEAREDRYYQKHFINKMNKFLEVLDKKGLGVEAFAFFQWYHNSTDKYKAHYEFMKQKNIAEISNHYCINLLRNAGVDNPSHDLIELKRQQIVAKRLNKQLRERIKNESNCADV